MTGRTNPIRSENSPGFDWTRLLGELLARYGAGSVVHELSVLAWTRSTRIPDLREADALLVLSRRLQQAWIEYTLATEGER